MAQNDETFPTPRRTTTNAAPWRATKDGARPNGSRRPTMKEVAAVAGVSLATVSRVVNADANVRPDLAAKVRDAVALLGYRRDLAATNLRRADRVSASLGLIVEDVSNPFHAAMLRGVETVARARAVLTLVGSSDEDPERERELADTFLSRRVDGLIVVPSGTDHSYLRRELDAGVGLAFVDRPPAFIDADCVLSDNHGGTVAATEHLLAAGHRRIGYLGDNRTIYTAVERLRGHRDALAAHGVAFDEALVRMDLHSSAMAAEAARELLDADDPPTALLTAQNLITLGALQELRARRLQHRVAVVGFDDLPLADQLEPGLTVVAQDAHELGRVTAELLFSRLDGDGGPARRVEVPTTLIPRGSGELAP
jgi:LacI family transcriptional regulator, galactose operon repressor